MAQGYAAEPLRAKAASGFHDDGHDHRPPLGLFVHKSTSRPTNDPLHILDIGAAITKKIGDGFTNLVGALVEKFFCLGGVDPTSGDDFGP